VAETITPAAADITASTDDLIDFTFIVVLFLPPF
jgi:hypothetical protein